MFQLLIVIIYFNLLNASLHSYSDKRFFKNSLLLINQDNLILNTSDDEVSFFAIGDWGGIPVFPYVTLIQQSTAGLMTSLAKYHNTKFQLALGDNFYFDGVKNANDKRFKQTYENVFNSNYLENTPWFVLLGNHDHYGNASAQIEYMQMSNRWIIPKFNYTINVLVNNDHLLSILMLDTVLMCGNTSHDGDDTSQPEYYSSKEEYFSQFYFLAVENELKKLSESGVKYIIVAGHYPVWSVAEHGPTKCLVERLRTLLHKYKISAYFSGHDHNLQHISHEYMEHQVEYIISGASDFVSNSTVHINDIPIDSLKFHWPGKKNLMFFNGGFILVKANQLNMTITFFESNGNELYQNVIYPRN